MAPTNDKAPEFIDLCVICRQGITRNSLMFVNNKSYHITCYAAFATKQGNVKPA